jgi:hypothetical protein
MSVQILEPYEHEWTFSFGDWKFGVEELSADFLRVTGFPPTSVHVGPTSFDTSFSAYEVVGIGVVGALLLVAAVALVITRGRSGNTT